MDIVIESLLDGATRATGHVAIIDVFRAFTTAAVALANGASRIMMIGTVEDAWALRVLISSQAQDEDGVCRVFEFYANCSNSTPIP